MAIVTRYFSDSGAGAADGTTWADRAALLSAGAFSTVITGFNFSGSDSLLCYVEGAKTYTVTNALDAADFANAPTIANQVVFVGCDSSGTPLAVPDPDWTSDQPAFSAATLPDITTTTNIRTTTLAATVCTFVLVKLSSSGSTGGAVSTATHVWCHVTSSANNASAQATQGPGFNTFCQCTGAAYNAVAALSSASPSYNCRFEGVAGSSGNRDGVAATSNTTYFLSRCTIVGNGGKGITGGAGGTSHSFQLYGCTIANNAGDNVEFASTASQTVLSSVIDCQITGSSGGYGIDGQNGRINLAHTRFRDNSSGATTSFNNRPVNIDIYTTDSDDATEYANSATGDYRIAHDAATADMGFGVSTEQLTPAVIAAAVWNDTYSPNRTVTA